MHALELEREVLRLEPRERAIDTGESAEIPAEQVFDEARRSLL